MCWRKALRAPQGRQDKAKSLLRNINMEPHIISESCVTASREAVYQGRFLLLHASLGRVSLS